MSGGPAVATKKAAGPPVQSPKVVRTRVVPRGPVTFGGLIVLWHVSAVLSPVSELYYPTPLGVAEALVEIAQRGMLPSYIRDSLWRWFAGVALGLGVAVPMGLLFSFSRLLNRMFLPTINFFHAIVELAWVPLFIIWFGFGFKTIVSAIAYVVFFPVIYNTMVGFRQVPEVMINASLTLGANRWQIAREVMIPGALPSVVTGLRLGAGYGWRALVGAEMLAATSGLGYLIFSSRENQLTSRTVAGMVIIGILWLFIDRSYLRPLERATVERWGLVKAQR
jgi:ABC-type nitrate/sulfonate/bicarbonate transport system permease component